MNHISLRPVETSSPSRRAKSSPARPPGQHGEDVIDAVKEEAVTSFKAFFAVFFAAAALIALIADATKRD